MDIIFPSFIRRETLGEMEAFLFMLLRGDTQLERCVGRIILVLFGIMVASIVLMIVAPEIVEILPVP